METWKLGSFETWKARSLEEGMEVVQLLCGKRTCGERSRIQANQAVWITIRILLRIAQHLFFNPQMDTNVSTNFHKCA
ncbi:MAG: hypothetical protein ACP5E3_02060 [Bacteroidales bacterium]